MSKTEMFESACYAWWRQLHDPERGAARADLARLKRASDLMGIISLGAVQDLNKRLSKAEDDLRWQPERLALIAQVLAYVKVNDKLSVAQRMGQGDPPPLSALRFDRLIRTTAPLELASQMRRALAVVDRPSNISQLARDLRWWDDATRTRWCFDYYGASQSAPDALSHSTEADA